MEGKCKRSKYLGLFREELIKFSLHELKKWFPTSSQTEFEGPDKNLGFILNLKVLSKRLLMLLERKRRELQSSKLRKSFTFYPL